MQPYKNVYISPRRAARLLPAMLALAIIAGCGNAGRGSAAGAQNTQGNTAQSEQNLAAQSAGAQDGDNARAANGDKKGTSATANDANAANSAQAGNGGRVVDLTAAAFRERVADYVAHPREWVFRGQRPALIDFYADWCGPCRATAPVVAQMARLYAGRVDVYRVDVDAEQELAAQFGIQSIPALLFIPTKGQPRMQVGAMGADDMKKEIEQLLR